MKWFRLRSLLKSIFRIYSSKEINSDFSHIKVNFSQLQLLPGDYYGEGKVDTCLVCGTISIPENCPECTKYQKIIDNSTFVVKIDDHTIEFPGKNIC